MPPECQRCGYRHGHSEDCYPRVSPIATYDAAIGAQKKPASLARLKAEAQQVLATIAELEAPHAH